MLASRNTGECDLRVFTRNGSLLTARSAMPIIWAGKVQKETLLSGSGKTIREMVSDGVRKFGRRTFLHYGEERYSFKDMDLWTDRVASGLNRFGLRHGDRIALLLSNRPEFVFFLMELRKLESLSCRVIRTCHRKR